MLQLRERTAPTPGLVPCYPETRIGLFGVSGETSTEPFAFVSASSHRAFVEACGEVTADLAFFLQEDPIGTPGGQLDFLARGVDKLPVSDPNNYSYALLNPVLLRDPLGLCSQCDDCPSGQWTYNSGSASLSLGIGGSTSFFASYTCIGNPLKPGTTKKVNVKVVCGFGGLIFGAGAGWSGSTPILPGGCGCNASDLLGTSEGWMGSAGPFSADVGPCQGTGPATTLNIGISKSWGAGFARTRCTTTLR